MTHYGICTNFSDTNCISNSKLRKKCTFLYFCRLIFIKIWPEFVFSGAYFVNSSTKSFEFCCICYLFPFLPSFPIKLQYPSLPFAPTSYTNNKIYDRPCTLYNKTDVFTPLHCRKILLVSNLNKKTSEFSPQKWKK